MTCGWTQKRLDEGALYMVSNDEQITAICTKCWNPLDEMEQYGFYSCECGAVFQEMDSPYGGTMLVQVSGVGNYNEETE